MTAQKDQKEPTVESATESTPLLSHFLPESPDSVIEDVVCEDIPLTDLSVETKYDLAEGWYLVKKAVPVLLTYLMQYSLQIASVFTLGHLGSTELAASALGSMFASVTGWSIAFGAATALDTLCSQAWTSNNPKMVGVYLQRSIIIILLMFTPIACIWWKADVILIALGQNPGLASKACLFLRYLSFGAPAFLVFELVKKYLQAQGIMKASTYVLAVCSILNITLNYLLVWYKPISLGFIGAPIATATTYWCMFILIILYTSYINGYQAWGGWTRACLHDWASFMQLAIPGILMVCSEWWAFELVALAAGYLGDVALATQSIVLTTASLVYQLPYGVAVSTSNRVGNLLGAGFARRAKLAANMSLLISVVLACCNSTVLLLFKDRLGYLFTDDEAVVIEVAKILPLCAAFQITDGISAIAGGVLRGQGRQKIGAIFNLIGYYLVALPLGLTLAFGWDLGVLGLWTGLAIASFLVGMALLFAILKTDWQREVEICQNRIKGDPKVINGRCTDLEGNGQVVNGVGNSTI